MKVELLRSSVRERCFAFLIGSLCAVLVLGGCVHTKIASLSPDSGPASVARSASETRPLSSSGRVVPQEELREHCDQLARSTPGIEELRMKKDGSIESRQWILVTHDSAPRWAIASTRSDRSGGWAPQPGIARREFKPPIQPALANGASQFLAYAPMQSDNYDESLKIATVTEVFGGPQGNFQWRGKKYGYTLTSELVCFPQLQ